MRNRVQLAGTVVAMALLVVGLPATAAAQTQNEGGPRLGAPSREYVPTPQINLTGMLKSDGAGGYVLVDEQSGDSICSQEKGEEVREVRRPDGDGRGQMGRQRSDLEDLQRLEGEARLRCCRQVTKGAR